MNILFICKYNRFRSRIAESYFNQLNKDKTIKTKSAGIIVGSLPLDKEEVSAAKKLGIKLDGIPKPITTKKLKWHDVLIICADNVPEEIFKDNEEKYGKKTIVWKIPDVFGDEKEEIISEIIKQLMKKIEEFIEFLPLLKDEIKESKKKYKER